MPDQQVNEQCLFELQDSNQLTALLKMAKDNAQTAQCWDGVLSLQQMDKASINKQLAKQYVRQ